MTTDRITPREAAELLGISPATLSRLRKKGGGPPFSQPTPRVVLYLRTDVEAYASRHSHQGEAP